MSIVKKKVSQLPVADSIQGLKAFGVDSGNRSVQIPLEFIKNAADNANTAAQNADDARLAIQDDLALKADQADLAQLAGFMIHPVIEGIDIGRVTRWDDIPAKYRMPWSTLNPKPFIVDFTIDQSTKVHVGDGTYTATTINGMNIKGVATSISGESGILLTEEPVGWSTRTGEEEKGTGGISRENFPVTTGSLMTIFEYLKSNGYVPVTYRDVLNWKDGKANIPRKCFHIMSDDYHLYLYDDLQIRKVFDLYGVKPALCISYLHMIPADTEEKRRELDRAKGIIQRARLAGWEVMIHGNDHDEFIGRDSKKAIDSIIASIEFADKQLMNSDMWCQGSNFSTLNSLKMMEHNGIRLCVAVTDTYTIRATNNMYIPRRTIGSTRIKGYI